MKRWWLLPAGVLAVIVLLLPPRTLHRDSDAGIAAGVRGAVHVHTSRSDGSGSVDDVAAAAGRAGLQFVVFSDHGDARRPVLAPAYRHGVLCIDAVEISSAGGHILAIGLTKSTAYPLGGEPRDVIADIERLGAMSVVAHPTSGKSDLQWRDWDLPFDGVEWLNADSEWRDESVGSLARAVLTFPWRRVETMTMLLDRPSRVLEQWDRVLRRRRVVALAGADAHASLGFAEEDNPYGDGSLIALPDYEPSFKTFSISLPAVRLTGDAGNDARTVISELEAGRLYSSIDGLARPGRIRFTARSGAALAQGGEELPLSGPVTLDVITNAPEDARIHLLRDGRLVAQATGAVLHHEAPKQTAAYRAEVYLRGYENRGVPWVLTNPIFVGGTPVPARSAFVPSTEWTLNRECAPGDGCGIEKHDKSEGGMEAVHDGERTRFLFHYALRGAPEDSPWVAMGVPAGREIAGFTRLAFRARTERPMRIWVQLQTTLPDQNQQYWRRSVYIDDTLREIAIPFEEMLPIPESAPRVAPLARILTIMFVVDTLHTPLGSSGNIWIDDLRYQR
jgi:hypothetical protein